LRYDGSVVKGGFLVKNAIVLLIVLWLTAIGRAATEDDIQKAEKGWAAAVMAQDQAALNEVMGDQLIYAHSTGAIEGKTQYLSNLKRGAARYDLVDYQNITVKAYGDAAVAHSTVRMTGQNKQGPFDNRLMMMHLWVKQDGKWRLAAHQTTRLP
jgi:ketosteroid isomerase-like protein